jgi:hypothetical protein
MGWPYIGYVYIDIKISVYILPDERQSIRSTGEPERTAADTHFNRRLALH